MQRFTDKVVLVTGGGSGLGRAAAVRLASEGAKLALVDVSEKGLADSEAAVLEAVAGAEVLTVVRELAAEGMTLMMVTHEMAFARDVCSRVVFMHEGRVHEIGPPAEIFADPKTPELRRFLGVG